MAEEAAGEVMWMGSVTRNGRKYWSFKLDDDEFYRTGMKKPPVEQGQLIEFTYEDGQYGKQVDIDSIVVQSKVAPRGESARNVSKAAGRSKKQAGGITKDDYWNRREERDIETQLRIAYQAATNTAVEIVVAALEKDILPIGGKSKADKWDQLFAMVEKVADDLFLRYQDAPKTKVRGAVPASKPASNADEDDVVEDDLDE